MSRFPRLVCAVAIAVCLGLFGLTAPAHADDGCITRKEFDRVHTGTWKYRAHKRFGTKGHRDYVRHRNGHVIEHYTYSPCSDVGGAWIRYRDGHLYEKSGLF